MSLKARVIAPLFCALALGACSPAAPLPELGGHPSRALAPTAAPRDAGAPAPPPPPFVLADELRRLEKVTERRPSEHLDGSYDGEVLVSAEAKAYPRLGPSRTVGEGATLVERHLMRGTEEVAVFFAMVRRPAGFDPDGGNWEYLVVKPGGEVEQRGALPLCRRCHVDAPHDHLFGGAP
ncbi:MAG: hypothetical protein U0359_02040 [Byssovorax sp.]